MATTFAKSPTEIPTNDTVSFIESHVPSGGAILEIGCGSGHVAAKLAAHGYTVVGVDSDEQAASRAEQRGVRVVRATWPDVNIHNKVDAVVFTRSLHHMSSLSKAIAKTLKVLEPAGTVLIEDFAFDEAEPAAIEWFLAVVTSQKAQALLSPDPGDFIATLVNSSDPVNAWRQEHDHDLHSASEMTRAIKHVFGACETERVPYLYRYLAEALSETAEAASYLEEIYSAESRLGSVGTFALIGHRIVASAR